MSSQLCCGLAAVGLALLLWSSTHSNQMVAKYKYFLPIKLIFQDPTIVEIVENKIYIFSCLLLFFSGYNIGLGGVIYILLSEMFSPEDQKVVAGLCHASNWMTASILNKAFPYFTSAFGLPAMFLSLAVMMVLGMVFTKLFVPETRKKEDPAKDDFLLQYCDPNMNYGTPPTYNMQTSFERDFY